MRCCRVLVVFFLAVQGAFAQGSGKIVLPDAVFKFGSVEQGAVIDHDFAVKNSGTA